MHRQPQSPPTSRDETRRQLSIFGVLVAAMTTGLVAIAVSQDVDLRHLEDAPALAQIALFGQAFMPGLAAVIALLVTSGSARGLAWGWRGTRPHRRVAHFLPIVYSALAYAVLWIAGLGRFEPAELAGELSISGVPNGLVAAVATVLALTVGLVPWVVLALGEQVGWTGLLVPRLAERMRLPLVALWTGIAWTLFHLPLMLFVDGAVEDVPMAYAIATFAVSNIALGLPLAWLRLTSGSLWPSVILHAAHNAAIYFVCEPLTVDKGNTAWFAGETGVLPPLAIVAVVAFWWWRVRPNTEARTPVRRRSVGEALAVGD